MLFGIEWTILVSILALLVVGGVIIFSKSGVASGIWLAILTFGLFKVDYISLTEMFIYLSIYIVLGLAWATFRLIQDTKSKFKIEKEINEKKEEVKDLPQTQKEVVSDMNEYFKRKNERDIEYKRTDKEILSDIIENISFNTFSYRVFFVPIDVIDYIFTDLLKDLFIVIKAKLRGYLFKSILGENEKTTY